MIYGIGIALFVIWIIVSIIKGNRKLEDYSDTTKFILKVCYPTNQACQCASYSFGGGGTGDKLIQKKRLKDSWDIKDKETLNETVEWLIEHGHHEESVAFFEQYNADPENFKIKGSIKQHYKDKVLNRIAKVSKSKGILGWDLCRATNIVGWSYIAGYLTYEEAYAKSIELCKLIQQNFNSWEELMDSYIVGHFYWTQDIWQTKNRVALVEGMFKDKEDPVMNVPWNTTLTENE